MNNFMFEESAESDLTNARAIHGTPDHSSVNQAVERFMANLSVAWTERRDQIIVGESNGQSAGAIHVVGAQGFETSSDAHIRVGSRTGDTPSLGNSFHFNDEASEGLEVTHVAVVDFASASISYYEHRQEPVENMRLYRQHKRLSYLCWGNAQLTRSTSSSIVLGTAPFITYRTISWCDPAGPAVVRRRAR